MSATTPLPIHELFNSHLVNCPKCKKVIDKHGSFSFIGKIVDWLCPVGKKLYYEALKDDNYKSKFKPHSFPFVAKMYETVIIRTKGKFLTGKVVDKSISSGSNVVGYEVEVTVPQKYGLKDKTERYYVNNQNIFKAAKNNEKPKENYEVKRGSTTIRIGGRTSDIPTTSNDREPQKEKGFRIRIGNNQ